MKVNPAIALGFLACSSVLTGCGLKGNLERPAPIIAAPSYVEAAEAPAPEEVAEVVDPNTNAHGGEIPLAAPTLPVGEAPLDPITPS